jgi:tetratricopeptide (TPR) repeat protein
VWQEGEGDWQVRKFDKETWECRFTHLVDPTYQIADFLSDRVAYFGDLDGEGSSALNQALQHYKDTGVWLGLPKVPEDVIHRLTEEKTRARIKEEQGKILRRISDAEAAVRKDPLDRLAWLSLPFLYYQEQRYKDMENALKMQLKIKGGPYSSTYRELGKTYLAALSVSVRGKGIPILGYVPSNVTAEILGYSVEELRELAKENLSKAYEMDKKAGFKEGDLKELELALKAACTPSVEVFEELDRYKERERQEDERQEEERLNDLFNGTQKEDEEKDL